MILINPSPRDNAGIFQPVKQTLLPMGIGYLLAVCERDGITAHIVDEQIDPDSFQRICTLTTSLKPPYIFGFSVLTASFHVALTMAQRLKEKYPDCFIIFGGIHPTSMPEDCLSHPEVDIVVRGEGEGVLPALYRHLKNKGPWQSLEGISYRQKDLFIHNPLGGCLNIDSFPPFPYHRFDPKRYDLGFIRTSRGCPYNCIFCSNQLTTGKHYRFRPTALVLQELDLLINHYGVREIDFQDDNFWFNKARAMDLIDGIKTRGLHHRALFSCQGRGDNADPDLLKELFTAGFYKIGFGIETVSEDVMKLIKKGETLRQICDAIRLAKSIGFEVTATFMFGLPGEKHDDRMAAIDLAKELKLDQVKFNNAVPYPGTELYQLAKKDSRLFVEKEYQNFNAIVTFLNIFWYKQHLPYVPEGTSESEIRDDIFWAYLCTYANRTIQSAFFRPTKRPELPGTRPGIKAVFVKILSRIVFFILMGIKCMEFFLRKLFRYLTTRVH